MATFVHDIFLYFLLEGIIFTHRYIRFILRNVCLRRGFRRGDSTFIAYGCSSCVMVCLASPFVVYPVSLFPLDILGVAVRVAVLLYNVGDRESNYFMC